MKDLDRNKLNMFVMVDEFLLASVTITNKIVIFAALYQVFKDYVTEIFAVSEEQEKDQKGVTKTKQAVREALIAQLEKITRKCVGYASGVEDFVLLQMVRIASSQFKIMADADLVKKAESLVTELTPRLPDLEGYNVVESDLDLLTSLKNDFKSIYTAPVGNRKTKKQLTEQLSVLFSKTDAQLGKMDDQVGTLFDTDAAFHDEYFKKRVIVKLARRMRAFQMWITDDVTGLPVKKARVKIIKKDGSDVTKAAQSVGSDLAKNVKVSGAGGGVANNNMEAGEYYYEVSLGGYVTATGSFFVNDGLMTEVRVRLVKSE
jgi:5-hydroxyisourate hydrolase-like protein (transthyretin family)